jgi:tetratricopeptide (TPR) repeat protein
MAISNWFRRRAQKPPADDLLAALLDAFDRADYERAMHLINDNTDRIRTEFESWKKVPESVRGDAAATDRYVHTLVTIANVFERGGDRSLRALLEGNRQGPMAEWTEAMAQAERLTEKGQCAEAVAILRTTLAQISETSGTAVDYFRCRALGRLGIALTQQGDRPEAIRVTREALEICRRTGDDEGVTAYLTNLRALGSYEIATPGGEHRFTVSYVDSQGQTMQPEELAGKTDRITWEIHDGGDVNAEARRLHDEGRSAGEREDYDAAIELFTRAAALDSAWPYPVYDRAFTHLLKGEFEAALTDYRKSLELAPLGFFVAATAADLLSREIAGEFPRGLYQAFAMLEHMPVEQQRSVVAQLVDKYPSHAPAWVLHAGFLEDPSEALSAIEHGLAARPDPDTRGSLLVQKALTLHAKGASERALEILEPLMASTGDSLGAHAKARIAAAHVRSTSVGAASPATR